MKLAIEADSDGAVHVLEGIQHRTRNVRPVLKELGDLLRRRETAVFATSNYGRWAPNEMSTVERKGSNRPNIGSGDLLRSLTSPAARGAHHQVDDSSVTVASTLVSAVMAHRGSATRPRRDPFPDLNPSELRDVFQTIALGIVGDA